MCAFMVATAASRVLMRSPTGGPSSVQCPPILGGGDDAPAPLTSPTPANVSPAAATTAAIRIDLRIPRLHLGSDFSTFVVVVVSARRCQLSVGSPIRLTAAECPQWTVTARAGRARD